MLNTFCSDLLKYMLKHILLHLIHIWGSTKNPSCFQSRPENQPYIWPFIEKSHLRPDNSAYIWPSPVQSRRSGPFAAARTACLEEQTAIFASSGALHYAKILASLKIKNGISLTSLNCALSAITLFTPMFSLRPFPHQYK